MAQKRPNPSHQDSLTVRQRDLARDPLPSPISSPSMRGPGEGAAHGRRAGDEGAQLEQTIAGSLPLPTPLPLGEVRVRVRRLGEARGEGAQRVAEILEA